MKKVILQISAFLSLGLGAGVLNGLLGTGGGVVLLLGIPHLPGVRLHDPRKAYTATLAVILPLSLLSALRYFRAGGVDLTAVCPLLLPAVAGGTAGAFLLRRFSPELLKRLFAALLLASGVMML